MIEEQAEWMDVTAMASASAFAPVETICLKGADDFAGGECPDL